MHCWESDQKVKNDLQRLPLNKIACCVTEAQQLETGAGREGFNAVAWRYAYSSLNNISTRKTISVQKPQLVIWQKKFSNRHIYRTCNAEDWSQLCKQKLPSLQWGQSIVPATHGRLVRSPGPAHPPGGSVAKPETRNVEKAWRCCRLMKSRSRSTQVQVGSGLFSTFLVVLPLSAEEQSPVRVSPINVVTVLSHHMDCRFSGTAAGWPWLTSKKSIVFVLPGLP